MRTLFGLLLLILAIGATYADNCQSVLPSNYTQVPTEVHITLKVDDALPIDPINGDNMRGFRDWMRFDNATIVRYFRAMDKYIKYRFGIDASSCTNDQIFTGCLLATDPSKPGIPNIAITPISYTGSGTYRVVQSSSPHIQAVPGRYPGVYLAEWIYTFLDNVNISGSLGAEVDPINGWFTEYKAPNQAIGGGVAAGRYAICSGGKTFYFDMRSWVVSRRWPGSQHYYYTERFQLGSSDTSLIPHGRGSLEIEYPGEAVIQNGKPTYPWSVYNNWHFVKQVAYNSDWDLPCGADCDLTRIRV